MSKAHSVALLGNSRARNRPNGNRTGTQEELQYEPDKCANLKKCPQCGEHGWRVGFRATPAGVLRYAYCIRHACGVRAVVSRGGA